MLCVLSRIASMRQFWWEYTTYLHIKENRKDIHIMPPVLALWLALLSMSYPVSKIFSLVQRCSSHWRSAVYLVSHICSSVLSRLQFAAISSNTDIPKYPLISKNIVWTHFLFALTFHLLLSQTTGISKLIFWYQKIYFEISAVWYELHLWDIRKWLYCSVFFS